MIIKNLSRILFCSYILFFSVSDGFSQYPPGTITRESDVPTYGLTDPLETNSGKTIYTSKQWESLQRPYILSTFETDVYGKMPADSIAISSKVLDNSKTALNGLATRKQVRVYLSKADTNIFIDVLMYLPNKVSGPVPVFLGYNFSGNESVINDPAIFLTNKWVKRAKGSFYNKATDSLRGSDSKSWPVQKLIKNGLGLVTAYYGDIEEDNPNGYKTGIRTTLKDQLNINPDEWGAIGAWAWGLSRILDYLQTDEDVNAQKVALIGHSRLGKVALWAGATDRRFAMVISNESGEAGAALSKRIFGETTKNITDSFPYWFVPKYKTYAGNIEALPVDQHMLLALIAPRPLYVASAKDDLWSDPTGEFLSCLNAERVYKVYKLPGLNDYFMPPVNHPIGQIIHYHVRNGGHGITDYDWEQYIKFALKYL